MHTVVFVENCPRVAEGALVGGKILLAILYDIIRRNTRQPPDENMIFKFRAISFDEQGHASNKSAAQGIRVAMPYAVKQAQHP